MIDPKLVITKGYCRYIPAKTFCSKPGLYANLQHSRYDDGSCFKLSVNVLSQMLIWKVANNVSSVAETVGKVSGGIVLHK